MFVSSPHSSILYDVFAVVYSSRAAYVRVCGWRFYDDRLGGYIGRDMELGRARARGFSPQDAEVAGLSARARCFC